MTTGAVQFYLFVGPELKHWYSVEVYENEAALHKAIAKAENRTQVTKKDRAHRALCFRFRHELQGTDKRWRVSPLLGRIMFNGQDMAPDVVAHELWHATIGWANRCRVKPTSKSGEERCAAVLEQLTRQFHRRAGSMLTPLRTAA